LVLEFDLGIEKRETFPRLRERPVLLYDLLLSDAPGKVLIRDGQGEREVTTFKASLGEVEFQRLDRPRTEEAWPNSDTPRSNIDSGEDIFEHPDEPNGVCVAGQSIGKSWWVVVVPLLALAGWWIRRRLRRPPVAEIPAG
jgi:hypothetical protein